VKKEKENIDVIAFYLPQYHVIPENNMWYGEGFTEWTNVRKAKSYYKGHNQPIIPGELGYYDLRNPQVRLKQAELAKEAGISAFCYYHYWFGHGKQLLEMPINEVVKSGSPDFPFCIAWANHTWYKKMWDAEKSVLNRELLIKQEYPGLDDASAFFYTLLPIFKDNRYLKIQGKLAFVFYKVEDIPYLDEFKELWQSLAIKENLPAFFFMSYSDEIYRIQDKRHKECDATILALNTEAVSKGNRKLRNIYRAILSIISIKIHKPIQIYEYKKLLKKLVSPLFKEERIYPTLIPNWDNTARRGTGAFIFQNSSPELFKKHCAMVFKLIKHKKKENQIVFLKSWNEWGEGNYLEPDKRHERAWLQALKDANY